MVLVIKILENALKLSSLLINANKKQWMEILPHLRPCQSATVNVEAIG